MKGGPAIGSKLLDKKWKSKNQEIHKQRLREVKSTVRNFQTQPTTLTH
jgi:hypothetical protein